MYGEKSELKLFNQLLSRSGNFKSLEKDLENPGIMSQKFNRGLNYLSDEVRNSDLYQASQSISGTDNGKILAFILIISFEFEF